jgi:hypothetical protein
MSGFDIRSQALKDCGAAAERLRGVENALDRVEANVRAANAASGR